MREKDKETAVLLDDYRHKHTDTNLQTQTHSSNYKHTFVHTHLCDC